MRCEAIEGLASYIVGLRSQEPGSEPCRPHECLQSLEPDSEGDSEEQLLRLRGGGGHQEGQVRSGITRCFFEGRRSFNK